MKKILLTGGSGMVGRNFLDHAPNTVRVYAPSHSEMDLLDIHFCTIIFQKKSCRHGYPYCWFGGGDTHQYE